MNLENLELKTYKNYKELCGILEEPIKGGKSKQLQMKEFERYFKYHKEGNKFIIDKIFQKPKEKMNTKSSNGIMSRINQGEYRREVFPLVKNFVGKNDIEFISKGKLLKVLKLGTDRDNPRFKVFLFEDTPELREYLKGYSDYCKENKFKK